MSDEKITTPATDKSKDPSYIEMGSLLAVQKIVQTRAIMRPQFKVEKALGFLQEKEVELKALGHEPSTEFNLFVAKLSKAYLSGSEEIAGKAINGVTLRVNEALLPENAARLASKDPELTTGEEKTKLLTQAQTRSQIIRELNTSHNHAGQEKCADTICTSSMAATAIMKPSDKEAVNKFATERQK